MSTLTPAQQQEVWLGDLVRSKLTFPTGSVVSHETILDRKAQIRLAIKQRYPEISKEYLEIKIERMDTLEEDQLEGFACALVVDVSCVGKFSHKWTLGYNHIELNVF